jgi:hypothetical protein
MKNLFSIICFLMAFPAFAQISADSMRTEQERIGKISKFQSIDFFSRARDIKQPVKRHDLVVLQDEDRKLYYGIVDSVKSLNSISIILYPAPNGRERVQATFDDIYLPKQNEVRAVVPAPATQTPEYTAPIMRVKENKQEDFRIAQAADLLEQAGRSYENADILKYLSYASFFVGTALSAAGSLNSSGSSLQAAGGILIGAGVGASIGSVVYRFRGHGSLKSAGAALRR